jgi:hypothetical protein
VHELIEVELHPEPRDGHSETGGEREEELELAVRC